MLITKKNIAVLFSCIGLFILACIYLYDPYRADSKEEYIGRDETSIIDVVDYHFIATNFAFTGQFPVTGYILDTGAYKIRPNKELNAVYLDMFKKNGPVTTFLRTPLYPLLVGSIYKIWGFKYYYNLRLNILLLAIIIGLMPIVGYSNWHTKGYISGIIGALIFLKNSHDHWFLNTMDIEVLSAFVFFLAFALGLLAGKKDKPAYYSIWGISIGIVLLVKPMLMPLPVVFALFIFIKSRGMPLRYITRKVVALLIGIALIVSPWTVYINYVKNSTIEQRSSWCAKVMAGRESLELSQIKWLSQDPYEIARFKAPQYDLSVRYLTNVVKTLWVYHSRTTGFIFITNAFGDVLLDINNEYCDDGGMHFEWRYIRSSFYRSQCSESQSVITKLCLFYFHYPTLLFRIPLARFRHPFDMDYRRMYWLVASLWGLCVMQFQLYGIRNKKAKTILTMLLLLTIVAVACIYSISDSKYLILSLFLPLFLCGLFFFNIRHKDTISIAFPILWLSLILFMYFIFPNTVYMSAAMPVTCLCLVYFTLVLIKGFSELAFGTSSYSGNGA